MLNIRTYIRAYVHTYYIHAYILHTYCTYIRTYIPTYLLPEPGGRDAGQSAAVLLVELVCHVVVIINILRSELNEHTISFNALEHVYNGNTR